MIRNRNSNESQTNLHTSNQILLGGEKETVTNNQGVNSYCVIDDNKFIKYYFEVNDEKIYSTPIWIVIDKSKVRCKRLNELDMLIHVREHISPNPCPKVYVSESCEVEFDEEIFNSIRSHVWYESSKIKLKRLVMEYIHGPTLQQFLIDKGLKVNHEKRIIEDNNVPKNIMINIYHKWFETLLRFIDENIIPDDLDNMSNIIVQDNNDEIRLITFDCSLWLIVVERQTHVLNEDLLYNYIWNIYYRHRRKTLDIIFALKAHKDWRYILKESLKDLIPDSVYERIFTDLLSKDHEFIRMKQQILMQLSGDNSMRTVDSYELFNMFVNDKQKYISLTNHAKEIIKELPFDITLTIDCKQLHSCWEYVFRKRLPKVEESFIFLHAKQYSGNVPEKIIDNVRYLIENDNNKETLTLYSINNSKCFFTTKNNNGRSICTNKYLPLVKSNNGCSVRSKYIGDTEIDERFFYDGFFVSDVELKDIIYVVLE